MRDSRIIIARSRILVGALFVVGVIFVGRLFYLQVVRHSFYSQQAASEQQKQFEIPAQRGLIYFKDGSNTSPAVLNSTVYTLYADQTLVNNPSATAAELAPLIPGSNQSDIEQKLTVKDNKPSQYVVLAQRLSKDQHDKILNKKIIGVNATPVPQRVYPEGTLGAQLLGFVNGQGQGQYGVEAALNKKLSGTPGRLKAVTDVNGVPLAFSPDNVAIQPKNGQNVVLTIDRNIQSAAEQYLKQGLPQVEATHGSILVIDPNTGAIKAMASMPSYDPAQYYKVTDYSRYQNRAVSAPYEMGSVMKVLTMAAGIDSGAIKANSTFNNTGHAVIDDFDITNVDAVPGIRTMTEILQYSLNTGAVWIVQQMGGGQINDKAKNTLYQYFTQHFGFGSNTGVEQGDEQPGFVATPAQSSQVRYANMAFGQGITTTMVQYAAAFDSVINGGKYYKPYVVDGTLNNSGQEATNPPKMERTTVSPQTSAAISKMVVTARQLTKSLSGSDPAGYQIGGKTGSAQIVDPSTGKYLNNLSVGSYIGFTGNPAPKYVIMVRVDDSKLPGFAGGSAAAPIFANLNQWLINYYRLAPQ